MKRSCFLLLSWIAIYRATAGAEEPDLRSFLKEHCVSCHGAEKQKGKVRLDQLDLLHPTAPDRALLERVGEQLALQEMPPEDKPQPKRAAVEEMIAAIENLLALRGERISSAHEKLQRPDYGNYVDHDTLFTEPPVRKASTPGRIWRLNVDSWIAKTQDWTHTPALFRDNRNNAKPVSFPYQGPDHAFLDYANIHWFDKSTTEMLLLETEQVARAFMQRRWDPLKKNAGGAQERTIALSFNVITGRAATPEELASLMRLRDRAAKENPAEEADQLVVQAMLLRPEALFRSEFGEGEPDRFGRKLLSAHDLAIALGFAVNVAGPDDALLAALQKGNAHDAAYLASVLRPYLRTPAMRDRLLRFAQEYFEYPHAAEVFKDAKIHDYQPVRLVEDADEFVLRILDEDRDVLRQWLTSTNYHVRGMFNYHGTKIAHIRSDNGFKDYHGNYNLTEIEAGKEPHWVDMPADERAGLLTHPAWLLAFSDNQKNQAIQRGRWVTTKLLGGIVPDAPVEVDARLPDDPALTLREKMQVTRAEACVSCHKKMDPTGLPFEQFDLFGKYRTEENNRPVVTTGMLWGREVANPIEYVRTLADSKKVHQVFLRHVFRFFLGRNESADDAPTLIDMEKAYWSSQGSLKETVLTLLTSDSFLYRTP